MKKIFCASCHGLSVINLDAVFVLASSLAQLFFELSTMALIQKKKEVCVPANPTQVLHRFTV